MDESNRISNENVVLVEEESDLSPIDIQQQYFENLGETDWIKYEKCNRNHLLRNIAFALFGGPTVEEELIGLGNQDITLQGYTSRQKEKITTVFYKLCEQCKYSPNNEDVIVSIILVVCVKPKPLKFYQIEPSGYWLDLHNRKDVVSWHTAVFCIRKCISTTDAGKCCRIYIDDNARVYSNWDTYLKNNTQPKCVLVLPMNGYYQANITNKEEKQFSVLLNVVPSPALGLKSRVLSSTDKVSTALSLGAIGVIGAAAFTPIAPVALITVAAVSAATGAYGLVRSSLHLHDRRIHEQSIGVADAEARGSWINIAASSVGLAGGAASGLLARSAAAGSNLTTVGKVLANSVNVLRHANIVAGGAGIANGLHHAITKYRNHKELPTALEVFQLTSSALFFCHAAFSANTAEDIVKNSQTESINNYRDTLRSNRHRKIFDKVSAETRRVQGAIQGNTEVIRGIKNIANKDQFYADVLKINKDVNAHKIKISMTSEGQVNLNSQYKFQPSELSGLDAGARSQLFSSIGEVPKGPPNVPTKLVTANGVAARDEDRKETPHFYVRPYEVIKIGITLYQFSQSGSDNINKLLENLSQDLYAKLMAIVMHLLRVLLPAELTKLKIIDPDRDLIEQVVKFVFNYLNRNRPLGETDYENDFVLTAMVKDFFQDGKIKADSILILKDKLVMLLNDRIQTWEQQNPNRRQLICPTCEGITYTYTI